MNTDPNIWLNTLPKKKTNKSTIKYSLTICLFVIGLIFVSVIKNETRNLQKEINKLQVLVDNLRFDIYQSTLEHEVITSPENISKLAKDYLDINFVSYKKPQIKHIDDNNEVFINYKKTKQKKKVNKNLPASIKSQVAKRIKKKKTEIKKLQELYSNPKSMSKELKSEVTKQIKEKKIELKNIYNSPKDTLTAANIQKWGVVQVVKAFLGIPIVPGR